MNSRNISDFIMIAFYITIFILLIYTSAKKKQDDNIIKIN